MIDLPSEIDERDLMLHMGRFITSRHDWTVSDVGGCIPIEPPITAPAGSHIIAGGELIDAGLIAHYNQIAMYVDGQRVVHYQLVGGKFLPLDA